MYPFRTILFAADFSDRSREAFRVACLLSSEAKTRLFVVHAVEPTHPAGQPVALGDMGVIVPLPGEAEIRREAVERELIRYYVPNRPVDTRYRVVEGYAADVLVNAAGEVGADLIVMGTHGRTGVWRLLSGSVAEAVLRKAACPVLALRSSDLGDRLAKGVRGVLHPVDLADPAPGAFRVARELARDLGARLVLLHVAPPVHDVGLVPVPADVAADRAALDVVRARAEGADLKTPVESYVWRGEAAPTILRAADELDCGMVVLGTHGRTGLGRLVLGSVAESVLRGADLPVLVVRTAAPQAAEVVEQSARDVPVG